MMEQVTGENASKASTNTQIKYKVSGEEKKKAQNHTFVVSCFSEILDNILNTLHLYAHTYLSAKTEDIHIRETI